jgi:hypothetical protein
MSTLGIDQKNLDRRAVDHLEFGQHLPLPVDPTHYLIFICAGSSYIRKMAPYRVSFIDVWNVWRRCG